MPGDTLRRDNWSNAWYQAIWVIWFSASLSTRWSRQILEGAMPAKTGSMTVGVGAMQPEIALRASFRIDYRGVTTMGPDRGSIFYSGTVQFCSTPGRGLMCGGVVKFVPQLDPTSFLIRFNRLDTLSATILRWGPKVSLRSSETPRYTGLGSKFTVLPLYRVCSPLLASLLARWNTEQTDFFSLSFRCQRWKYWQKTL